jgi:hypothetical protein
MDDILTKPETNNLKLIEEMKGEFGSLYKRMDEDRKLYLQEEYKMTDNDGQEIPHIQNVTMNDARTFAERAMSLMSGVTIQPECQSNEMKESEKSELEEFDHSFRTEIDNHLIWSNRPPLYDFFIEQACIRGSICCKTIGYHTEDGGIKPESIPIDTRYFTYEYSRDEMMWGNAEYWRSKAQVEHEYGDILNKYNVRLMSRNNTIYDFWNGDVNEIYVNKKKVKEEENILKEPPFIFQKSGAGSMLMDKGSLQYGGESIYGPVRKLYPEINKLASILQTLNMMTFAGGYQYENDEGEEGVPDKNLHGLWAVLPVKPGQGYRLIPVNDVKQATRLFYALIQAAIQRGSLPNIDYGNLTFPLSAVAISKLTQTKDAIFIPRLEAISLMFRKMIKVMGKYVELGGAEMKLGDEGLEKGFNAELFKKKYTMFYHFYTVSPDQDAANAAIAQQQAAIGLPQDYIFRETLKLQDPDAMITKARAERAERMDSAIFLYRLGHSLIKEAEKTQDETKYIEARFILNDLTLLLKSRNPENMAGMNVSPEKAQGQTKPLVPVFGGSNVGTGATTPEEEMGESPESADDRAENRAVTVRKQTEEG